MAGWMSRLLGAIVAIGSTASLLTSAQARQAASVAPAPIDFNRQIRPLLSDRCYRCHGPDSAKRKAKLRLDTREGLFREADNGLAVVAPRDLEKSDLVRRISTDDAEEMMPPPDSHLSLTEAEKALLKRWVAEGADYKPHWSLVPVAPVAVPTVREATSITNPIDAFVLARLEQEGLLPTPRASPETIIRRLALNLTGLPPTPAEIDAFVADRSSQAVQRAADRYLASPAYGERMALDWADLARYADTYGYQNDVERDMSPYRDWVIRAFNQNLPYDQFLIWQLAGDLLPNATRDQRVATAFNRLHRQTNEGGSIEEEYRTEYVVDRVNTFGTAMLGLTVECARCHDHKFDPITQRDYFSLFAFFNNIDESGLYSHFTNATPSPSLLLWTAEKNRLHRQLKARIAATEQRRDAIAKSAGPAFREWLKHAAISQPTPIASLASEAIRFNGDDAVVPPRVRVFTRTDAFSFALRLQPTEPQNRAIVLHQSRSWSDAGSRGFELRLDHGRPFFGLIHFWPGNAVAVRATQSLPMNEWSRLAVTYDGSSRAAGIRLYLNGAPLEVEVVRDHLYKDITYRKKAGDDAKDPPTLTLGARFRDSGFKNGQIQDLKVFDTALTAAEVAGAIASDPADPSSRDHFLARHYMPYLSASAELKRLRVAENALMAGVPEIMVMDEMPQPRQTHLLKRGAYDAPGDVVSRDTPASLPPFPTDQPRDRLGLARWLTDRQNPLAARVVVNRVWRMHFGRGLVATQEDFGSQGRLPSHPDLLDWLAGRFMDSGWDVKALHRLIVSSATFQQSSHAPADTIARDPENLLLSRGAKMRMPAEAIRDSALAASGLLNRTIGGRSVKPYQPAGLWEQAGTGKIYTQDTGNKLYRRSLYTFWRRTSPPPSMLTFDAMSREVCTAKRDVTATPLQSLVLLNDPQFVEAARVLAQRLLRRYPKDGAARNRRAFRSLIGRAPDDTEARILATLFDEQRDLFAKNTDDAAKLLGVGEAPADKALGPVDVAAMTSVVSAILNFDEFVVVR
jgi:hypothetical protein